MTWQNKFQNALAHQHAGRLEAAERGYRATIATNPGFAAAHYNLGSILHQRCRFRPAIHEFETAAKLDSDLGPLTRVAIGAVFLRCGEFDRAERVLREAVAAAPLSTDPHRFLGDLMRTTERLEEAREAYLAALRVKPSDPEARFGLAFVRLTLGEMPEAWDDYECRLSKLASGPLQPVWNGESVVGRTLLVHSEQGLGDAIQFMRYVPLLAARGARVLLAVRQEIMGLAGTVEGAARVVEPTYTLPPFDFSCGLPSLPRIFRTTLDTIPANTPYLRADPARVVAWREKLGPFDGPTVAVAWRGNPTFRSDHRRSMLEGEIGPLLALEGVRFLIVQKDDEDVPNTANVIRLGSSGFDDVAALMTLADLTISVDTVVCHLAGALGRPVWTMLSVAPDWRWQLSGETTPWYPTMRLFRQKTQNDWSVVIDAVTQALADLPQRHT